MTIEKIAKKIQEDINKKTNSPLDHKIDSGLHQYKFVKYHPYTDKGHEAAYDLKDQYQESGSKAKVITKYGTHKGYYVFIKK